MKDQLCVGLIHTGVEKCRIVPCGKWISNDFIKNLIFSEPEEKYIECVYSCFSHTKLIIVCDDCGAINGQPQNLIIPEIEVIYGTCLICGIGWTDDAEQDICGIEKSWLEIAMSETIKVDNEKIISGKALWQIMKQSS